MTCKEAYTKLLESDAYNNWDHKDEFTLTSAISKIENGALQRWDFHFYNKQTGMIQHFSVDDEVEMKNTDKPLNPEAAFISLSLDEIKITAENALGLAEEKIEEKIIKGFVMLNNETHLLWNIIAILPSFQMQHIKVDAVSGDILSAEKVSLIKRE